MTVGVLLEALKKRYQIECAAGESGLSSSVTWYHNLEEISNIRYINGGELIILKGSQCTGDEWLESFVCEAIRCNACGIIVYTGHFFPKIPEHLIRLCNTSAFPLLALPWTDRMVDLTNSIAHRIIMEERGYDQLTNALRNAIISPELADGYLPLLSASGYPSTSTICFMWIGEKNYQHLKLFLLDDIRLHEINSKQHLAFQFSGGCLVAFINCTDDEIQLSSRNILKTIQHLCAPLELAAGISENLQGLQQAGICFRQAVACACVARSRGQLLLEISSVDTLKLLASTSPEAIISFFNNKLRILEDYDHANGTHWLDILEAYIFHNGSIQQVASMFFCHRNTINYTMQNIRSLLNVQEFNAQEINSLYLAFLIRTLYKTEYFKIISIS